jgi:hypothetical protein
MRTVLLRLFVIIAVLSGTLATAWASPTHTISVPTTLARSVHALGVRHQVVHLDYPATHIAFSWIGLDGSRVRFRTWSTEGAPSGWTRAPEVHGSRAAERAGRHFSAMLAVDRAVRVEWSVAGKHTAGTSRVTLDYLNTVDGPRREVEVPVVAAAAEGPPIVTRAQWGADESLKRSCTRNFYPLQQLFVHHTAGKNYDSNPKATMRAIYWYHVVRQGWCDIGYNFVIGPDGTVFEGRYARHYKPWELHDGESSGGRVVAGAHTSGYNSGSLGVSLMGNYSQIPLPPAARRSLVELLAWEVDRHGLDARARHTYRNPDSGSTRRLRVISGHRDAGTTACPGSFVYRDMRRIRRDVDTLKGAGRMATEISLAPTRVDYGSTAALSGTLVDAADNGMVAKPIRSYVKVADGRWRLGPQTVTGEDGEFELQLEATRNSKVIAVYEGDALTWGAQSRAARVKVAPSVTIETEGGTEVAGISHFPTGTQTVALIGVVDPPHGELTVDVRVGRVDAAGEFELLVEVTVDLDDAGNYRYDFVVPADDTYRAVAIFRGDPDHASSRSDAHTFAVGF